MSENINIFTNGMTLSLNIAGKPYRGSIVKYQVGSDIIVKLAKPDMSILHIMPNSSCVVRCISDEGMAYGFQTNLKNRKIPLITIGYPQGELKGVSVRKHERIKTSFWAQLKMMNVSGAGNTSKLEMIGDCNIVDMSMGGCKIMTKQELKKGGPIWVEFNYGEDEEAVQFKGIVRSKKPAPYESIFFGLEFSDIKDGFFGKIKKILENPEA